MSRIKCNRRKNKIRFSNLHLLVMVILLTMMTSASISAFEWLKRGVKSHILILKGVTVEGNRRVRSEDIIRASGLHVGIDSVYSTRTYILGRYIEATFSYIKRAEVRRSMNGWINISVEERKPLALIANSKGGPRAVIDKDGVVLEEVMSNGRFNVPMVIVNADSGNDLALDVLNTARSVAPSLFDEMSLLDVRDPDKIVVRLQDRGPNKDEHIDRSLSILIAADRIKTGLSDALVVVKKLREENAGAKYVDARFPGVIYCGGETCYGGRWKSG